MKSEFCLSYENPKFESITLQQTKTEFRFKSCDNAAFKHPWSKWCQNFVWILWKPKIQGPDIGANEVRISFWKLWKRSIQDKTNKSVVLKDKPATSRWLMTILMSRSCHNMASQFQCQFEQRYTARRCENHFSVMRRTS